MAGRGGWGWRVPHCEVCGCQAVTTDEGDYLCARCYSSRIRLREAAEFLSAQTAAAQKTDQEGQKPDPDA